MYITIKPNYSINRESAEKLLNALFAESEYVSVCYDEKELIVGTDGGLTLDHDANESLFKATKVFGVVLASTEEDAITDSVEKALKETEKTDFNVIKEINVRPTYARLDSGEFVQEGYIASVVMSELEI